VRDDNAAIRVRPRSHPRVRGDIDVPLAEYLPDGTRNPQGGNDERPVLVLSVASDVSAVVSKFDAACNNCGEELKQII
jgi:hypothetical protein